MEKLSSLSLVLPAHNEEESLAVLLPHIAETLPKLAEKYDVIMVDDGSTDATALVARTVAEKNGIPLTVVTHQQRMGYGATVGDGLRAATGEFTAFTDADGQFDVADLAILIPLLDNAGIAAGWRMGRSDAKFRSVISGTFKLCLRLFYGITEKDVDCALKIMRTEVLRSITLEAKSALINAELFFKAKKNGYRIAQAGIPHHPRTLGVRKGGSPKAIARAIKELILFRIKLARGI